MFYFRNCTKIIMFFVCIIVMIIIKGGRIPCGQKVNMLNCNINRVQTPVVLLHSLLNEYPGERHEPSYHPSHGLNNTTTVLFQGWLWH